jgi:hypothetical protein
MLQSAVVTGRNDIFMSVTAVPGMNASSYTAELLAAMELVLGAVFYMHGRVTFQWEQFPFRLSWVLRASLTMLMRLLSMSMRSF